MASNQRVVVLYRHSLYESLLARHATHGQAVFFLKQRGLSIEPVYQDHLAQQACIQEINRQIPATWRYATIERAQLDRFDFLPDDLIVVIGQDGLVPNVSKYLAGQQVIGFDPAGVQPGLSRQLMVNHHCSQASLLFKKFEANGLNSEKRTMLEAQLDDSQKITALNEVFIGHMSHQSAKYDIAYGQQREYQSSSGIIVATGTGSSGWMSSINSLSRNPITLPDPEQDFITFRVREPWLSSNTRAEINAGIIDKSQHLQVTSKMESQGVIFGDGIEQDFLSFDWGQQVTLRMAQQHLHICTAT
jgi:hypothetical protein